MTSIPRILLVVVLILWFAGSASAEKVVPAPKTTQTTAQANNRFACDLLRQLTQETPDRNLFFSPWSISTALGMTLEGARGNTALEMGQILGLPKELRQEGTRPWDVSPYHEGFADLQKRCQEPLDPQQAQAIRTKLVEMRKQLQILNEQIRKDNTEKVFAVQDRAVALATQINQLQQQVDLFELRLANAVWGERTYPFEPAFMETIGRHYGIGVVRQADFVNQFARERATINRWVEEQTKDRIKDLIPKLPPEEGRRIRMILVNAIYFKGQWLTPFDKHSTRNEPFVLADGSKRDVSMMGKYLYVRYAAFQGDGSYFATPNLVEFGGKEKTYPDADGFQMVELPYKGDRLSMVVIVPQNPKGLAGVQAKLTGDTLANWTSRLQQRSVITYLPRFKLETDYSLADNLKRMGMKDAFDDSKANFEGMSRSRNPADGLVISHVLHKAFVEVNEEGTEAAAASAVMLAPKKEAAKLVPFIPTVRADRPFLFMIRHNETGAVLFLGRMMAPDAVPPVAPGKLKQA